MKPNWKRWLPGIILLAAGGISAAIALRAHPEAQTKPAPKVPTVQFLESRQETLNLTVSSQGTVAPVNRTTLIAQVNGDIAQISTRFFPGEFFRKGDILLEIESHDYDARRSRARAELATARLALEEERALADQARVDWNDLSNGPPPPLAIRQPQLAKAGTAVEAAEADLAKAEIDYAKTTIRAPYTGIVRNKHVGPGQYVTEGTLLAEICSVDTVHVRLPVTSRDLAYLDMPLIQRESDRPGRGPVVTLTANLAGKTHSWRGGIVRTEGVFDSANHLVYLVAEVQDPYALDRHKDRPPLPIGLFVRASIEGRSVGSVIGVPVNAVHGMNNVWVIDTDNALRRKQVRIIYSGRDRIWTDAGLTNGDRICLTALDHLVEGMQVNPAATSLTAEIRGDGDDSL